MKWETIKIYSDAMSYCQNNDWKCLMQWAKHLGATKFSRIDYWKDDIPYIIKNGCMNRSHKVVNPGENDGFNWLDHARIYKNPETGQCWVVSHIYNNTPENLLNLFRWCEQNDLALTFLYISWYNPGNALGVEITNKRISETRNEEKLQ